MGGALTLGLRGVMHVDVKGMSITSAAGFELEYTCTLPALPLVGDYMCPRLRAPLVFTVAGPKGRIQSPIPQTTWKKTCRSEECSRINPFPLAPYLCLLRN